MFKMTYREQQSGKFKTANDMHLLKEVCQPSVKKTPNLQHQQQWWSQAKGKNIWSFYNRF